ncbi:MAG TPA: hypothetical protein VG389_19915 [Myxococcota bacterium]|nr:hypothetical protein [Myxococcota bacterium]
MSRHFHVWVMAFLCVAVLGTLHPAHADGKAVPGYVKGSATVVKAKPGVVVVRPAPARPHYAPYKSYAFRTGPKGRFHDGHPLPGGGWCRIHGWHYHTYTPVVNPHWVLEGGAYVYLGVVPDVVIAPAPAPTLVYTEPLPPPVVVRVDAGPPPPPRVVWIDGPDCREKYEVKKDGVKYEYKCKHHGKGKGHHKHGDGDDDD